MTFKKEKCNFLFKFRYSVVYIVIIIFILFFYEFEISEIVFKSTRIETTVKISSNEGFVIKTSGCRIQSLDPFDKSVLPFIYKPPHINCSTKPPLVSSNDTSIYIESSALINYNITDLDLLTCFYKSFWRVNPTLNYEVDNKYEFGQLTQFFNDVNITDEFVKVVCYYNNSLIYKDFHSFVTEKRKNEILPRKNEEKLNVLIIGLDAISRLNLQRTMPKTVKFLKEQLNSYEMIGYNKVGDNTFPNLIPILTGLSQEELTALCWETLYKKFDECPFIWKNFSKIGYLTSFAEDSAWMGIFNYEKFGFEKQPTDYYYKTFNFLAEKSIGHTRLYNADLCIGTRTTYTLLIQYMMKFIKRNLEKPFFGFFWGNSLSHDNLNFPALGDINYKNFFSDIKNTNVLNKTILIFLSDHGIRWGGIRTTHQGQLEERLPFLFFSFPSWFKIKYSTAIANLIRNTRRLTTPFDLHETIADLLKLKKISTENIKLRSRNLNKRGISLFLPIPENRTCESAYIAQHWCTCQRSISIDKNDTQVISAANFLVDHMNKLLEGHLECAVLNLNRTLDARLLKTEDYLKNNSTIHDYILIIETVPGGGLFEGTVRFSDASDSKNSTSHLSLTGVVSRINLYGKQSACISNFHLKLYCYCG